MSKVHGNNGNASFNDLVLPKNFVKITTIVNGIIVPANRSSVVICIHTSLKSAISAYGILRKQNTRDLPTTQHITCARCALSAIVAAAIGLNPSAIISGPVKAAGVPNPATTSIMAPNKNDTITI